MTCEPKGTTILTYRTDENGRWSLDVPLGAPTVSYDMLFFKLGYRVDIQKRHTRPAPDGSSAGRGR